VWGGGCISSLGLVRLIPSTSGLGRIEGDFGDSIPSNPLQSLKGCKFRAFLLQDVKKMKKLYCAKILRCK